MGAHRALEDHIIRTPPVTFVIRRAGQGAYRGDGCKETGSPSRFCGTAWVCKCAGLRTQAPTIPTTRSGGRRPKSAKARNRGGWGSGRCRRRYGDLGGWRAPGRGARGGTGERPGRGRAVTPPLFPVVRIEKEQSEAAGGGISRWKRDSGEGGIPERPVK
jgi:hypothetical protein